MPKLSVIIPVYNVELYLRECIDSVLASSFRDFELILIDDGSKDMSAAICDGYIGKDERIKVLHVQNGGVSRARNIGIDNASAEWITFIDSDDFVSKDYLERLYSAVEQYPDTDYVHAGCMLYGEKHDTVKEYEYPDRYSDNKNFLLAEFRGLPFSKLFKRKIIQKHNIRFDEKMKAQEDLLFSLDYIYYVNKYVFLNSYEYFHRTDNQTSIMHSAFSPSYEYSLNAANHFFYGVDNYVTRYDISDDASLKRKKHAAENISFAIYSLFTSKNYDFKSRLHHLRNDYSPQQLAYLKYCVGKRNKVLFQFLRCRQYLLFNVLLTCLLKK